LTDLSGGALQKPARSKGTDSAETAPEETETAKININLDDEVVRGSIVLHEGKMMWPAPAPPAPPAPPEPGVPTKSTASKAVAVAASSGSGGHGHGGVDISSMNPIVLVVVGAVLLGLGLVAPNNTLSHFTVFILAIFVGYQVVWNVKPALHTPLMSVTNAISGIILVGGMLQLIDTTLNLTVILGAIATLIAAINIAGGFLVTNRMLGMFRK
jgi:NAD(P) transhydrogenase subunit alpha